MIIGLSIEVKDSSEYQALEHTEFITAIHKFAHLSPKLAAFPSLVNEKLKLFLKIIAVKQQANQIAGEIWIHEN